MFTLDLPEQDQIRVLIASVTYNFLDLLPLGPGIVMTPLGWRTPRRLVWSAVIRLAFGGFHSLARLVATIPNGSAS